jgi:hypothetical protein
MPFVRKSSRSAFQVFPMWSLMTQMVYDVAESAPITVSCMRLQRLSPLQNFGTTQRIATSLSDVYI